MEALCPIIDSRREPVPFLNPYAFFGHSLSSKNGRAKETCHFNVLHWQSNLDATGDRRDAPPDGSFFRVESMESAPVC